METQIPKLNRDEHFARLNAYSSDPAWQARKYDFDALVGQKWEIDRDLYWHFLEVLPPLRWIGGAFLMREFLTDTKRGTITSRYSKVGERYFHEYVYVDQAAHREAYA